MGSIPASIVRNVEQSILLIRGHKVMLDSDLAALYGVSVKRLNEQVRRNSRRFPRDFMFQLTAAEFRSLRSHIATLKKPRGGHRKYPPLAFTEQGVSMLSGVLNSDHAIDVNIEIMRAFVRIRHYLATHAALAARLNALERRHEAKFEIVFEAIRQLSAPPPVRRRPIGFRTTESG